MKSIEFQAAVRSTPFGDDMKRVPGRGIEVIPGLAVGRSFTFDDEQNGDSWRIHHIRSGRGFGYFHTRAAAVRAARKVAPLIDWTKSMTAIRRAKIAPRVAKIVRAEGGWGVDSGPYVGATPPTTTGADT